MSEPFLAEIRIVGFNFAPRGWATCDGSLLPIAQNTAVFSLLGVNYGGNGTTVFALPNLQGRVPMQWGQGPGLSNRQIGEVGGTSTVSLLASQMPQHVHAVREGASGPVADPANASPGPSPSRPYASGALDTPLSPQAILPVGGGQPHNNQSPVLSMLYVIALQGIFPSRA